MAWWNYTIGRRGSPVTGQTDAPVNNPVAGQFHLPNVLGGGSLNPHIPNTNTVVSYEGAHAPVANVFAGLMNPFWGKGGMFAGGAGYSLEFGGGPTPKPAQKPLGGGGDVKIAPEPMIAMK